MARTSVKFTSREAALVAARGHYPVDYLVARGGNTHYASGYAYTSGSLEQSLGDKGLFADPKDVVYVWLPKENAVSSEVLAMDAAPNGENRI